MFSGIFQLDYYAWLTGNTGNTNWLTDWLTDWGADHGIDWLNDDELSLSNDKSTRRKKTMFFNVIIQVEGKEWLVTDCFYYNEEQHYLNYHSPYSNDQNRWCTVSNVECEIEISKPMIYITVKPIKEEDK